LQSHEHRQEQWTVIEGKLTVVLGDEQLIFYPGESVHIPLGAKHRAWNNGDDIVQFIEVQTGTYFGEDDITRYEDDYGRDGDGIESKMY
jgi:mannose-6-phosphate isomerase